MMPGATHRTLPHGNRAEGPRHVERQAGLFEDLADSRGLEALASVDSAAWRVFRRAEMRSEGAENEEEAAGAHGTTQLTHEQAPRLRAWEDPAAGVGAHRGRTAREEDGAVAVHDDDHGRCLAARTRTSGRRSVKPL